MLSASIHKLFSLSRNALRPPFVSVLVFVPLLTLAALAPAAAQEMPPAPEERLWQDPGPEQSSPGAPRLLIVYPLQDPSPVEGGAMRYAGRVEPENAAVTLNGQPLALYPGGIFTGTRDFDAPGETWRFEAITDGKKTTVERVLRQEVPPAPAPAWPLEFFAWPVSPSGDMWLRPGATLPVTLYASPGHRAQIRVGETGAWKEMTAGPRNPDRGGIYRFTLAAPRPLATPSLQTIYFRLSGSAEGESASRELKSRLRVATLPENRQLWGRVVTNLATFFKNGSASDGTRWGNFIQGTPFPVLEGRGERVRAAFERGETGWLENASIELDKEFQKRSLPSLAKPQMQVTRQALTLAWPAVTKPVACVFYPETTPDGGAMLRISLPGAAGLKKFSSTFQGGGIISAEGADAKGGSAPTIRVRLSRPLWGYAMTCDPEKGLRITVRTRPSVGTTAQPLAGLRVMLDAGHGGLSLGERGPSGLLEKDINLVQAAWLERTLTALGAEVRQVRRTDVDIDLDARVDLALAWNPDLFISLHHNSVGYGTDPLEDSGPIVFHHYPHSKALSDAIAAAMADRLNAERGARSRTSIFRVNRNLSLCPAVLIESAFICNPRDEIRLRQAEHLKASAEAIAQGVKNLLTR